MRTRIRALFAALVVAPLVWPAGIDIAVRRTAWTENWHFFKGDAPGAEQPGYDDSAWRVVDVPHDWAIEGPFDSRYDNNEGGLPCSGTGWYRRRFTVPPAARGKQISVEFDGVMSNSRVFLNGRDLGGRPYGYSSFAIDLTPAIRYGQENVLAVKVTPEEKSSRWYSGAGLYRNVWLVVTGPVHVAHWGTYLTAPEVSAARATVAIRTTVENRGPAGAAIEVETSILDAQARRVARADSAATVAAGGSGSIEAKLEVANPQLWDIERPYLYSAVTVIRSGKTVLDRYTTPFGVRTIACHPQRGFLLNGRHVRLQGVCNHHDLGALGAAVNRRAVERQLEILKSMGVNALRTSHNPPAPEVLEACDRLGILVMDEAFDMWRIPKVPNGYAKYFDQWGETDLRDLIRRDRNHPSVILWSIGNEVPEQNRPDGWKLAKRLSDICHQEDPSRPTTAAFDQDANAIKNGLAAQVDVPGLNYKPTHYAGILKDHPNWVILGSETASTVSSRGVYHLPLEFYERHPSLQVTSYDIIAPPWADLPDVEFDAQEKNPTVLGEFVWTGFDYLGEPTPYGGAKYWPARSSYFGIVDLCGFPKDRYYLYQAHWTQGNVLHLLPHWNWTGREGQAIPVMVYSNAEEVELFLNDRSLGRKKVLHDPVALPVRKGGVASTFLSKYRLLWQVPYQPGTLRAAAYRGGRQIAAEEVRTAGAPARIVLRPDRTRIAADGQDLSFITVRIEDDRGNLCPLAGNLVRFHVEGAGRIAAVDNGNAATIEPFQAHQRKAFNGLCLLIVRSSRGRPGTVRVSAAAVGFRAAEARLENVVSPRP